MDPKSQRTIDLLTETARDALTVRRVYGEPYVVGETTVVPVAKIAGGSGMGFGSGTDPRTDSEGDGGGGGFGVRAVPAGSYVIRGEQVDWVPAIDVNRLALGGQVLAGVAVLAWALRRRR